MCLFVWGFSPLLKVNIQRIKALWGWSDICVLVCERLSELWTSTIPALALMSGDKNSLEHFEMLTNISAKPALNIRFLTLPEDFEQIVLLIVSATLQLHWNWWRAKPTTLLLQTAADLSGTFFFPQFVSDGRIWISIMETGNLKLTDDSCLSLHDAYVSLTHLWTPLKPDTQTYTSWNKIWGAAKAYSWIRPEIWSILLLKRINNKCTNHTDLS